MLSNLLRLPYKLLLESGDCSNARFSPDFGKQFISKPSLIGCDSQEEKLNSVNRLFAMVDPEMWNPTPETTSSTGHVITFPLSFLTRLLPHLPLSDMKSCRLVCKQWTNLITSSSTWKNQLVAILSCSKASWVNLSYDQTGSNCASYLEMSKIRFSYWSYMRLRHLKSHNLHTLLTFHASSFGRSVKNIHTLEIRECHFTWMDLLELLYLFRNLKTLYIIQSHFTLRISFTEDVLITLGLQRHPNFQEVIEEINEKCPEEDYFFSTLKSIHILEDNNQNKIVTPLLLAILKGRTGQMDEFELCFGRTTAFLKNSVDQNYFWQSVHSFLAQKNVIKCDIKSVHGVTSGLVNRFFTYMNLWKFPPPEDEFWRLREFIIDLRPLVLLHSFERHLIPLIQRLPNLELLFLRNILLRGNNAHFVKDLMEKCHQNCQLKIGLILDDQGGIAASRMEKELLSSNLFQKRLISVEVMVHTDSIREICDMIPFRKEVKFPAVTQFVFSTSGLCRPRFFSFNVNMIVHNFPNLTELRILDGPLFQKSIFSNYLMENQWRDKSGAVVGDEDMQLILRSLVNLQKLVLRANMKYLTNSGFTGLSGKYCRMISKKQFWNSEEPRIPSLELIHRDGVSFANLPKLKHLSIEGIGSSVTDVTAFLGFRSVSPQPLEFLGFYGPHQISIIGKEHLQCMFPDCKLIIT